MATGVPFAEWAVVDWSAAARPVTGRDSVWVAHGVRRRGRPATTVENPPTRAAALDLLISLAGTALARGRPLVVGLDFSFGYPAGFAARAAPADPSLPPWRRTWRMVASAVADGPDNANDRFSAAEALNRRVGVRFFWGRPQGPRHDALVALPPRDLVPAGLAPNPLPSLRLAERLTPGVRSGWQLYGRGSVGGQVLTGLGRLEALLGRLGPSVAVWPFETGVGPDPVGRPEPGRCRRDGRAVVPSVVLAELWPPAFAFDRSDPVPDRAQVTAAVAACADRDADGWREWLSPPTLRSLGASTRRRVLVEEGWLLGLS